jgi:hypothetical protein
MIILSFIGGGIFIALLYFTFSTIAPALNRMFAMVWSEDTQIKSEAVDRIKELYVNGELPEESALLMASVETGESESNILAAFNAMDAEDLAKIIRGKPRSMPLRALSVMESVMKRNIKRTGRRS